jgi:hypothetical protein
MVLLELPSINFETGEVRTEYNVKPSERPELWFSAKKVLDRESLVIRVNFCVDFVNKILSRGIIAPVRNRKKTGSFWVSVLKTAISKIIHILRGIERAL